MVIFLFAREKIHQNVLFLPHPKRRQCCVAERANWKKLINQHRFKVNAFFGFPMAPILVRRTDRITITCKVWILLISNDIISFKHVNINTIMLSLWLHGVWRFENSRGVGLNLCIIFMICINIRNIDGYRYNAALPCYCCFVQFYLLYNWSADMQIQYMSPSDRKSE